MDVLRPLPAHDLNLDSSCSSPYITAPSSPQRFAHFYFSAPTSPNRASFFHSTYNNTAADDGDTSPSAVPFNWEEKPGTPKFTGSRSKNVNYDPGEEDFEFDFSGQLERTSLSAEELFDGGKIRPLKPPPGYDHGSALSSPRSPRSPKFKFSPKKEFDPFAAAIEKTRSEEELGEKQRGRRKSRSLSPLRVSDVTFDEIPEKSISPAPTTPKSYASSILSAISFSKKWKFRDLLLFRSASEGRAANPDPLRKYWRKEPEDVKNSSFRSAESGGSVSSRRRGPVSAHELHYTANRAVSEELKRKTALPYKRGLLGCLGFNLNPGVNEISRGIGSLTRG